MASVAGRGDGAPCPATGYRRRLVAWLAGWPGYGVRFAPRVTTLMVPALSGVALPGAKS
jgi:hypothetical protein